MATSRRARPPETPHLPGHPLLGGVDAGALTGSGLEGPSDQGDEASGGGVERPAHLGHLFFDGLGLCFLALRVPVH
jgi:hypothetical protein